MAQKAGSSVEEFLKKAIRLQNGLIAWATGKAFDDTVYQDLRRDFIGNAELKDMLPAFVHRIRDLAQFWQFIKHQFSTYKERREFIWDQFRPLIDYLEAYDHAPNVVPISEVLKHRDKTMEIRAVVILTPSRDMFQIYFSASRCP